jgi:hypothetical protein
MKNKGESSTEEEEQGKFTQNSQNNNNNNNNNEISGSFHVKQENNVNSNLITKPKFMFAVKKEASVEKENKPSSNSTTPETTSSFCNKNNENRFMDFMSSSIPVGNLIKLENSMKEEKSNFSEGIVNSKTAPSLEKVEYPIIKPKLINPVSIQPQNFRTYNYEPYFNNGVPSATMSICGTTHFSHSSLESQISYIMSLSRGLDSYLTDSMLRLMMCVNTLEESSRYFQLSKMRKNKNLHF